MLSSYGSWSCSSVSPLLPVQFLGALNCKKCYCSIYRSATAALKGADEVEVQLLLASAFRYYNTDEVAAASFGVQIPDQVAAASLPALLPGPPPSNVTLVTSSVLE